LIDGEALMPLADDPGAVPVVDLVGEIADEFGTFSGLGAQPVAVEVLLTDRFDVVQGVSVTPAPKVAEGAGLNWGLTWA
jgi:hypothetical protein